MPSLQAPRKKAACVLLRLRKTQEWHSSRIFLYLLCVLTHWPYTPLDSHLLRLRVGTLLSPSLGTGQCWQQRPAQPASGAEAFGDVTSFCPHNSPTGRKFPASVLLCSSPDCSHAAARDGAQVGAGAVEGWASLPRARPRGPRASYSLAMSPTLQGR